MNLNEITLGVENGRAKAVAALVRQAIDEGVDVKQVLDALLAGMSRIGEKFKDNRIFVPDVLIAARALNFGLDIVKPILTDTGVKPIGKAIIGTVQGDLHDIGKNLVKTMLVGAGLEVVDIGVDVPAETFVDKAVENDVQILCMSALLTSTMAKMKDVIHLLNERGLRERFIVMIGGAPITAKYAEEIGADYYTADAATAAEVAREVLLKRL